MNRFEKDQIKERIIKLARMKSTGTPAELGERLEISERSVKRAIKEIREEGIDLRFDYVSVSYVEVEH
jgi:biotin operon repressor